MPTIQSKFNNWAPNVAHLLKFLWSLLGMPGSNPGAVFGLISPFSICAYSIKIQRITKEFEKNVRDHIQGLSVSFFK